MNWSPSLWGRLRSSSDGPGPRPQFAVRVSGHPKSQHRFVHSLQPPEMPTSSTCLQTGHPNKKVTSTILGTATRVPGTVPRALHAGPHDCHPLSMLEDTETQGQVLPEAVALVAEVSCTGLELTRVGPWSLDVSQTCLEMAAGWLMGGGGGAGRRGEVWGRNPCLGTF